MRRTASNAIGEISLAFLPLRMFFSTSASSKNLRRAWLQHSAGDNGPGIAVGRRRGGCIRHRHRPAGCPAIRRDAGWMFAAPIAGEAEDHRRRRGAAEGPVIAHIGPEPRGLRAAAGEQRDGGIIAVQSSGGHHMRLDQRMQRRQQLGHRAHLVGERGQAQIHAFAGIALGLPVQRLVLAELLEHDHGEQAGAGPAARDRVERGWRLADLLAVAAGELLADGLDHLPLPRDHLQRLGDVLAHLHDPVRPAACTGGWRLDHHPLARQMLGERLLHGFAPVEGARTFVTFSPARRGWHPPPQRFPVPRAATRAGRSAGRCVRTLRPYLSRLSSLAISSLSSWIIASEQETTARVCASSLSAASARASAPASSARNFSSSEAVSDMAGCLPCRLAKRPCKTGLSARFIQPLQGVASSADCASQCPPEDSPAALPRSAPRRPTGSPAR